MFLCVWHVLKCWLTNLRNKLVDKLKFLQFFHSLRDLMYMEGHSDPTATVAAAINKFEASCNAAGEPRVLQYFQETWKENVGTIGSISCHSPHSWPCYLTV